MENLTQQHRRLIDTVRSSINDLESDNVLSTITDEKIVNEQNPDNLLKKLTNKVPDNQKLKILKKSGELESNFNKTPKKLQKKFKKRDMFIEASKALNDLKQIQN